MRTKIALGFSGACFLAALYTIPGEFIVQFGLRKIAFEQGIQEASKHWDFVAAPNSDPNPEPSPKTAKAKIARR